MRSFLSSRATGGHKKVLKRLFSAGEGKDKERSQISFDISSKQYQGRSVYMDLGATTPLDFRVLDSMMPYMTDFYGNPHSRLVIHNRGLTTMAGRAKKQSKQQEKMWQTSLALIQRKSFSPVEPQNRTI